MKVWDFQLNKQEWSTLLSENKKDDTCLHDSQGYVIPHKVLMHLGAIDWCMRGWGSLFLCHCTAFTAKMKSHLNVHYFRKQWCLTRNQTDTSTFQEQAVSVAWFVVGEKVIVSTVAFLLSQHVMNGCYFPGEWRVH